MVSRARRWCAFQTHCFSLSLSMISLGPNGLERRFSIEAWSRLDSSQYWSSIHALAKSPLGDFSALGRLACGLPCRGGAQSMKTPNATTAGALFLASRLVGIQPRSYPQSKNGAGKSPLRSSLARAPLPVPDKRPVSRVSRLSAVYVKRRANRSTSRCPGMLISPGRRWPKKTEPILPIQRSDPDSVRFWESLRTRSSSRLLRGSSIGACAFGWTDCSIGSPVRNRLRPSLLVRAP